MRCTLFHKIRDTIEAGADLLGEGAMKIHVCAKLRWELLSLLLAVATVSTRATAQSSGVVYVSNSGANVSAYIINPVDGTLSPTSGSPFPNPAGPSTEYAVHPSMKFLYVADPNSLQISVYSIDGTGNLKLVDSPVPISPPPPCCGLNIGMDPKGRFLYASTVWGWPSNVYGFTINQDSGALTPITTGMPATAGSFSDSHAFCMTVDPSGRFAYVCNQDDGTVSSFVIDQSTGALINPQQTQSGLRPRSVSIEPTGHFAYVVNYGVSPPDICQGTYVHGTGEGCVVRAFSIDQTTGVLTSIGPNDTVSTGTNPLWSAIDPAGKDLYVVNIDSNDLSAFSIDPATGTLTPIGTYSTGQGPDSVNVDPLGKFVYVSNFTDGTTYSYTRDATGALTQTGIVPGVSPQATSQGQLLVSILPVADSDWGFAQLTGGNTITGNQTVNGSVTANAFAGNGAGLTNVTASGLGCAGCVGNSQLGINYAVGDTQGGNALNALALGGFPASAFAPASGSPSYVAKAGDTMTGTLTVPSLNSGSLIGTTAVFTGLLTAGGAVLPATGTATANTPMASSNPLDLESSVFNTNTNAAVPQLFRWQAEGNTSNASGTLNLLSASGSAQPAETGLSIGSNGVITFAPGQTFPGGGSGTITGVSAGTGLSGGGTSGSVTLANTGVLSLAAGNGISSTGGQSPTLSLNTSFTDGRYAQLSATNIFTANQTVPNLMASGTITSAFGSFSGSNTTQIIAVNQAGSGSALTANGAGGVAVLGTNLAGGSTGVYATGGNFGVVGYSFTPQTIPPPAPPAPHSTHWGIFGWSDGTGVFGGSSGGYGVYGGSPGIAGAFNTTAGGKILSGQNNGTEVFSVASNGNVSTSGSLATTGSVSIGGGTPIMEYVSTTLSITLPALTSGSCMTFATAALTGYTPGTSDTIALGVPSDLVFLPKVFVFWQAWETNTSPSPTITVQVCNPSASRYAGGAADTIRVDVFKH